MFFLKYFKKKKLREGGQAFLQKVTEDKKLHPIVSPINLQKSEKAFYAEEVSMRESRKNRGYSEIKEIDSGVLVLTNKRLVFDGGHENRFINLEKVLSVKCYLDAVEISVDGRAKSILFFVANPYIWALVITIVQKVDNPEDLSGIDLDIKID